MLLVWQLDDRLSFASYRFLNANNVWLPPPPPPPKVDQPRISATSIDVFCLFEAKQSTVEGGDSDCLCGNSTAQCYHHHDGYFHPLGDTLRAAVEIVGDIVISMKLIYGCMKMDTTTEFLMNPNDCWKILYNYCRSWNRAGDSNDRTRTSDTGDNNIELVGVCRTFSKYKSQLSSHILIIFFVLLLFPSSSPY